MLTDFQITEANIGEMLPVENGFVVSLVRTAPPVSETPRWTEGGQKWLAGYFCIRGQHDLRDLICLDATNPVGSVLATNHSLPYRGGLVVRSVPRQSQWRITLSEVPVVRAP